MVSQRFFSTVAAWLVAAAVTPALATKGCDPPEGVRKVFDWTVTWDDYAQDGVSRKMLLVEGTSPGPVLEVNEGDIVEVNVHNESPQKTSIHFHGIEMQGTPWSDGVPGVTQRAIQPGASFKYEWTATQHGSHWYHAHSAGQIEDGLYGAILIHPKRSTVKPWELISSDKKTIKALERAERHALPLLISDLTHLTSEEKWERTVESSIEHSCYDSLVFNGKGRVTCLDPELVAESLSPQQELFLGIAEANMTDKSCLPAAVLDAVIGGGAGKPEIWDNIYSGCTPTEGSIETIEVKGKRGKAGAWVAIDLIGANNFITGVVSIDEHDMWVYQVDGSYIAPQKVDALVLANGDRYSVLVHTTKPGNFKIRAHANSAPQIITGYALLAVKGPGGGGGGDPSDDDAKIDLVGAPVSEDVVFFDPSTAAPFPPSPIAQKADALYRLDMFIDGASYLWALNGSRLMPEDLDHREQPVLLEPDFGAANNVTITTKNDTWVDLVFYATVFPMPPHPIHKHGNKMYEIGRGLGDWTWASVEEAMEEIPESFNLVNPPRRDAFSSPEAAESTAWTVVRYHVTNPGPWLLHCHINNHVAGGMMMVIQDGEDVWPEVPEEYQLD